MTWWSEEQNQRYRWDEVRNIFPIERTEIEAKMFSIFFPSILYEPCHVCDAHYTFSSCLRVYKTLCSLFWWFVTYFSFSRHTNRLDSLYFSYYVAYYRVFSFLSHPIPVMFIFSALWAHLMAFQITSFTGQLVLCTFAHYIFLIQANVWHISKCHASYTKIYFTNK